MREKKPEQYLAEAYESSGMGASVSITSEVKKDLEVIAAHRERCKAVLAVIVTLMLKKIISPDQDIRKHQARMTGGFSARGLDANVVTPFLRKQDFPYMKSGAGALTRSLEQAVPYDKNYTGKIQPKQVKDAFLSCVDALQNKNADPNDALIYLFVKLITYRDLDKSIKLNRPVNLSIKDIVSKINEHFEKCGGEGSRLPVLAIYAVYKQLVNETQRYKNCFLCELQAHNAPDSQSGFLGDIQVNDSNGNPFEVVEIKHNKKLNKDLVNECYSKFKSEPVKTYYLLSTDEELEDHELISQRILHIEKNHGCQMIVNGIQTTLKYYLRLLSEPHHFLHQYVDLVEKECSYNVKVQWQKLWD